MTFQTFRQNTLTLELRDDPAEVHVREDGSNELLPLA